jgi:hypothetical protein
MLGQFDPELKVTKVPPSRTVAAVDRIDVGGPLTDLDPQHYDLPLVIHYSIVQSREAERDEESAAGHEPQDMVSRRGVVIVDALSDRWSAILETPPGFFAPRSARGIAVAVLPRKNEFAYETLTWCGHIRLKIQRAAAKKPAAKAKKAAAKAKKPAATAKKPAAPAATRSRRSSSSG